METYSSAEHSGERSRLPDVIEVPAPTAWPLVLASGSALMFAGLLTNASLSVLGLILAVAGCAGWFREVLPHEKEVAVPIIPEEVRIATERKVIERLPVAPELVRAWLPIETYPISAGVKGGWAGSVAMAVLACTYGLLKTGSIWYPINLLAATVYSQSLKLDPAQLNSFHFDSFAMAVLLHGVGSTLVGLLYGAMLPMFPRRPILLGGLIAPVLWSGLLYSMLNLLNPLLASRIDWFWFIASQVAFGVVAGLVVVGHGRIATRENIPFALRAGVEAPGIVAEKRGKDDSR
ncbi:MAG TPA: hypothetical protein VN901_09245 [Candidatus Acidoferrales bacterium]|jgi:hypothetical protein|nr:hypothetical protein [Candidatus Acidoferrales bacterium]